MDQMCSAHIPQNNLQSEAQESSAECVVRFCSSLCSVAIHT